MVRFLVNQITYPHNYFSLVLFHSLTHPPKQKWPLPLWTLGSSGRKINQIIMVVGRILRWPPQDSHALVYMPSINPLPLHVSRICDYDGTSLL